MSVTEIRYSSDPAGAQAMATALTWAHASPACSPSHLPEPSAGPRWIIVGARSNRGESTMAKYLVIGSYTADGLRELAAHGASARIDASNKLVAEAGGSIESFYYAFGSDDVYILCTLPDNV